MLINIIPWIAIALTVGVIVWLNLSARGAWSAHRESGRFLVMRRRVKGRWEYREPTAEEISDDEWWWAIK